MNTKTLEVVKSQALDFGIIQASMQEYKEVTEKPNTVSLSIGSNDRLILKNRFVMMNYYQFLMFKSNPKAYEVKENKKGNLNIFLNPKYVCHHIDGNKQNDKIENIALILKANHPTADNLLWKYQTGRITEEEYMGYIKSISISF